MRVVVRQTSGLGNQLFQYTAARYLASRVGAKTEIAIAPARNQQSRGVARPYLLNRFKIAALERGLSVVERIFLSERPELVVPREILRRIKDVEVVYEKPIDRHRASSLTMHGAKTTYLVGYWQCHQFARAIESTLRSELVWVGSLSETAKLAAERIEAANTPVSVHIRRGDYLSVFGPSAVLPSDYYRRAIDVVRREREGCKFFVFSDDLSYARELLEELPDVEFLDHGGLISAEDDLRLMSSCHHHIIANSSFSWWGAWLNARADKLVIAPDKWIGFKTRDSDLIPPEWLVIDAEST